MNQPTPGQSEAIYSRGKALFVSAGAGTGKTRTLAERFINLLDQEPNWPVESILAVTFTEKAAREMRGRIRDEVMKRKGEAQWQKRLGELERLQVSTIHSLCARLLRENAIAAGLDPQFTVLDELEAVLIKEEAIRQAISELVDQADPSLELLANLQVRDLHAELTRLLEQRGVVTLLFEHLQSEDALLERWKKGLEDLRREIWMEQIRINPNLESAMDLILGIETLDPSDKLAEVVESARAGCLAWKKGSLGEAGLNWLNIRLVGGKALNWGGSEGFSSLKDALKSVRAFAEALRDSNGLEEVGDSDLAAARLLGQWRRIWETVSRIYDRLKAGRDVLDFDDLEIFSERLFKITPLPERLQATLDGFRHLMVDEFQDTNLTQAAIVFSLAHPSQGERLFVVGDAKQSIYRFRQAQVAVFNRIGQEIESLTGRPAIRLEKSFRTHQGLVAAVNTLFNRVLQPIGAKFCDYEAAPGPLSTQRGSPPIHPAAPASVEVVLLSTLDVAGEKILSEEGRIFEARWLANRLIELVDLAYPVYDRNLEGYRPFRFGDAAVLLRATTDFPIYEEQFKLAGLPYLTVSGRGYYDRPEVQAIYALLSALDNPADDLNLATALRSQLFCFSDETLYRLRWKNSVNKHSDVPIPIYQALCQPPLTAQPNQVAFARQVFDHLKEQVGLVDNGSLLRNVMDQTGFETTLALNDLNLGEGGRSLSNLRKLLAIAQDNTSMSLSDFLVRIQDLRDREAREGEAPGSAPESGAVQLMSIHAAKGLEFPVVAVADLGRSPRAGGNSPRILHDPAFGLVCQLRDENGDWVQPAGYAWAAWLNNRMEKAESKRLFYVACTRAGDLLLLSGRNGKETWMSEILAGWELYTESMTEDQIEAREGFTIRMRCPPYFPADRNDHKVRNQDQFSPASEVKIPQLARPLVVDRGEILTTVTRFQRLQMKQSGDRPIQAINFVHFGTGSVARGVLIGRVAHRILMDWKTLALPEPRLVERIQRAVLQEGGPYAEESEDIIQMVFGLLYHLKRSPLYKEIDQAVQKYTELPFALQTPEGMLNGRIDLLFQGRDGEWNLIDWKTDLFPVDQLAAEIDEARFQVMVYARACEEVLNIRPVVRLCFLALGAKISVISVP